MNQSINQKCTLSLTLFSIYIDELVREWKKVAPLDIWIGQNECLNIMFFANNQTENQMLEEVAQSKLFEMWFNIWGQDNKNTRITNMKRRWRNLKDKIRNTNKNL